MDIGKQIRELRKKKDVTLTALAEKSGVALATLSRIETGRMSGTVESHIKVAEALGVPISEIYNTAHLEDRKSRTEVSTRDKKRETFVHDDKSSMEIVIGNISERKMLPIIIKLKVGGTTAKLKNEVGVEKFFYITEGRIDINVADEVYHLKKGDAIYIDGSIPHRLENAGDIEASCVNVVVPPVM